MKRERWLLLPALLIGVAAAYYPAWNGGLLWDDAAHLTDPALQSLGGLWRIWTDVGATQQYYPLAHSAFWLQHQLWGDSLTGYHLINIALHATSAFLIALLLWRLSIPGAVIAAAIFALHPLQVESVAWISELKNTLSTVFYLGAALLYLRFDQTRGRRFYIAALVLFLCALFTKTVTATLPAALLVLFWWQRGTIDARRDVAPLAPFFTVGIVAGLFTAWVERTMIGAQGAEFDLSLVERILIAGRAVWFYLGKLLWPSPLIFIYPRWEVNAETLWQYAFPIALMIVLVVLWRFRNRTRAPLAAMLLFCGALFPALGFIDVYPFRFSFVADHFAYLASIPAIVFAAAALSRVPKQFLAAVAVPVLMLAVLTWRQSANYASAETLYRATLEENPSAWMAHNNLGKLLAEDGRNLEARSHFTKAVQLNGDVAEHHMNLGRLLVAENVLPEAERHLSHAMRLDAGSANARSNLGVALMRQGKSEAALTAFAEALRIDPEHAEARENLAALHVSLGVALAQSGRIEEAAPHFAEAASIKPDDAMIRYNLGTAYLALGRARDAVPHLEEAVRLAPSLDAARANLEAARRSTE